MKKLSKFITLSILSAIILTSCGHGLSITKRRYTKGYYVSGTKKHAPTKNNPSTLPELYPETRKVASHHEQEIKSPDNLPTTNALASAALNNKKQSPTKHVNASKPALPEILTSFSCKKPFKTIEKLIDNHKLSAGSDDDGLSLFWIVILIVLILWLLGFISGNFGGIINLLLIIALILLILWLLKVL